jgi:hypothetical protein
MAAVFSLRAMVQQNLELEWHRRVKEILAGSWVFDERGHILRKFSPIYEEIRSTS